MGSVDDEAGTVAETSAAAFAAGISAAVDFHTAAEFIAKSTAA